MMGSSNGTDVMSTVEAVLAGARAGFDASTDFTLGVEEEYALLDPQTLDLVPGWETAHAAAIDAGLGTNVAGELLASEIEFRTGRCESYADAVAELKQLRLDVVSSMRAVGFDLGISGTHPWADYREQQKIDEPYYRELVDRLQYVAHRNNTFGLHVHVGVRGAERAIAVANALRDYQPALLALSASSPFLDGRDSGLASSRSLTFSRTFPRGNLAPRFASFEDYLDYLRLLARAGTISSASQVWWGVRAHMSIGTVELRMFDGQPNVCDTLGIVALAQGLVAHLCHRYDDEGALPPAQRAHLVDENLWRAARFGTRGSFIDLPASTTTPVGQVLTAMVERARVAGHRAGLGIDDGLDHVLGMVERGCSSSRQRDVIAGGGDLMAAYRSVVAETMATELSFPIRSMSV